MTSDELLTLFRSEMSDQAEPYLWPDVEVYGYIDAAHKMFCRNTDGIADAITSAVTQLNLLVGDGYRPMHPSILKLRAVTRTDTGKAVEVINFEDMAPRDWKFDNIPGLLKALIIGEQEHFTRPYPLLLETVPLHFLVYRMPLKDITDSDQKLEINSEHHRYLLHWIKSLAYLKQDSETFDRLKATEFEKRFNDYCGMAKVEMRRKDHKPRTVVYGGL